MLHQPSHATRSQRLRSLGYRLLTLADDVSQPSRSLERSQRLIDEGEGIAAAVRAEFR